MGARHSAARRSSGIPMARMGRSSGYIRTSGKRSIERPKIAKVTVIRFSGKDREDFERY